MSAWAEAFKFNGLSIGVGSYCYSEAEIILPVETVLGLSDEDLVLAVRAAVPKANALRAEEDEDRAAWNQERRKPIEKKLPVAKPGEVYLVRDHAGYFKIGISKEKDKRIFAMSMALPFELTLIACGFFEDSRTAERRIHERFASKRLNGEWFALDPEDVTEIKDVLAQCATPRRAV